MVSKEEHILLLQAKIRTPEFQKQEYLLQCCFCLTVPVWFLPKIVISFTSILQPLSLALAPRTVGRTDFSYSGSSWYRSAIFNLSGSVDWLWWQRPWAGGDGFTGAI